MPVQSSFPDEATLHAKQLDGTVDPSPGSAYHSTLHGDLGDTLEAYIAALGKVTDSGYNSLPTLFDPDSTDWDDAGWWQVNYKTTAAQFWLGHDDGTKASHVNQVGLDDGGMTARQAAASWTVQSNGSEAATFSFTAEAYLDGSRTSAGMGMFENDNGAEIAMSAHSINGAELGIAAGSGQTTTMFGCWTTGFGGLLVDITPTPTLTIYGSAAQTDPLLDLQDSDAASIFAIAPDGSVGGVAPNAGDVIAWDGDKWVATTP